MFTSTLNTSTRQLHVQLISGSRLRTETFTVRSVDHAIRLYKSNVARSIVYTLLRWVKQREWTMNYTRTATAKSQYAIDRIRLSLEMHAESSLEAVVRKVLQQQHDLALLIPGPGSRYRKHYENIIDPIIQWAQRYHALSIAKHRCA